MQSHQSYTECYLTCGRVFLLFVNSGRSSELCYFKSIADYYRISCSIVEQSSNNYKITCSSIVHCIILLDIFNNLCNGYCECLSKSFVGLYSVRSMTLMSSYPINNEIVLLVYFDQPQLDWIISLYIVPKYYKLFFNWSYRFW